VFRNSYLSEVVSLLRNHRQATHGVFQHYPSCGSSVSDIFVGRGGDFSTVFHGENTLALVLGEAVPVRHSLIFVDIFGSISHVERIESSDFRFSHDISLRDHDIFSFIHLTDYSSKDLRQLSSDQRLTSRNHRGYTGYRFRGSTMESVMHGNFGLVYLNTKGQLRSLARQRSIHRYSVQEIFSRDFRYELYFSNPTGRPLRVDVDALDSKGLVTYSETAQIPPFGAWIFCPSKEQTSSYFSWCTRLPVGRCAIFELSDSKSTCNVFHS